MTHSASISESPPWRRRAAQFPHGEWGKDGLSSRLRTTGVNSAGSSALPSSTPRHAESRQQPSRCWGGEDVSISEVAEQQAEGRAASPGSGVGCGCGGWVVASSRGGWTRGSFGVSRILGGRVGVPGSGRGEPQPLGLFVKFVPDVRYLLRRVSSAAAYVPPPSPVVRFLLHQRIASPR